MEVVDIMDNVQYDNLKETFKEGARDEDRVFEEETLIPNEEIVRENVELHVTYEDDDEYKVDAYTSDRDSDLGGNEDDYDDDLSP